MSQTPQDIPTGSPSAIAGGNAAYNTRIQPQHYPSLASLTWNWIKHYDQESNLST
eukprot:CAMPEP_0184686334 /NCGR_PEP_ID=MMETSP0312-20130426/22078_1 /TAXON_ID=31354 /ORGANISM="Compsopogon coeruleus, Strain SAG 36.94" /LENGTH=54 /DNA_ID=CAMNT_0027141305 /DNA_START=518 /DNA_END=682 /DNA_ORIENTATION=+